jgi:hypothetical protein
MSTRRAGVLIWAGALAVHLAFVAWYGGTRGALRPDEIDAHLARLAAGAGERSPERLAAVRAFLEADDGREFFMVNLVRMQAGEDAPRVLERYTGPFLGALLLRAGHPAFVAPAVATYLEDWGVDADPGWSFAGVVRYRSRRDMIELVNDPAFASWHANKRAAIATTLAFPATPARVFVGPRVWVGLALSLVAALAHLALLARRGSAS